MVLINPFINQSAENGWAAELTKISYSDFRIDAGRGRQQTLRCRRTPPKTDRHPRMTGSEF